MRGWLLIGVATFALMLALGIGAIMALSSGTSQAAALTSSSTQTQAVTQGNSNSAQALFFSSEDANNAQVPNNPAAMQRADRVKRERQHHRGQIGKWQHGHDPYDGEYAVHPGG